MCKWHRYYLFSLKIIKFKKNSEVLMPAMTYCSTIFSIIRAGLKPILVDINKNNPTISIDEIKKNYKKLK